MLKKLLAFLGLQKNENVQLSGKSLGGYKIHIDNIGFYDIKVGDKFEGAACGNFFGNQVCQSVDEGEEGCVIGSTTLVTFRKCNIRPIKEGNSAPYMETHGVMSNYKQQLSDSHKLPVL